MSNLKSDIVSVKSTKQGQDDKGREQLLLSFDAEGLEVLKQAVSENGDNRGLIIDVRTEMRKSEKGREFPSSFAIVRQKGEQRQNSGYQKKTSKYSDKAKRIQEDLEG